MFGRSGQMFPRQYNNQQQQHPGYNTATPFMRRAFHDAIYEEEYGSESDEECCRGRGFSAVLCWFLSVIILIGLAASVVLTVFFILKSRSFLSKNNGELDILYEGDQGNNLVYPPPSPDLNFDFPPDKHRSTEESEELLTTTTRAPPPGRHTTRKNQNSNERKPAPTKDSSLFNIFLDGMQKYENGDFPLTPSKESFVNFPNPASEEIISNESQDRRTRIKVQPNTVELTSDTDEEEEEEEIKFPSTTTTPKPPPAQQVLFTIPPTSATTVQPPRRNIQTTRFPFGRQTSASTTTTTTKKPKSQESKESKEDGNVSTNARYNPYGNFGRHTEEEEDEEEGVQKTSTTKDPEIDVYHSDEAQLKKMLLEEIPPHKDTESRHSNNVYQRRANSKERTSFTTPTTTTTERPEEPEDTLARIIKNLAPKWGRDKTETTTIPPPQMVTSPSASRYNVTMTSRDRSKSRESNEYNSAGYNSKENTSRQRIGRPSTTVKNYVTPVRSSVTTVSPYNHDDADDSTLELVGGPKPTPYEFGKKVGAKRVNEHPIKIIESPDLNKHRSKETENNHQRYGSKEAPEGEFLDVLVGSDDHKTLVTKHTADGIVTSAILPPWYDANEKNENISDVLKMNGTSMSIPEVKAMNDSHSEEEAENKNSDEGDNTSYPRSEFDLLLNLFSQSPLPKKGQNITSTPKKSQQNNNNNQIATIVTIKPKTMQADESNPNKRNTNTATRKTPNFKDLMKDLLPGLTSGPSSRSTQKPPVVTQKINKANTAFHLGSNDGSTDIYGYYPDEETDSEKYVQQHRVESEKLTDDMLDEEDPIEESPSHVIDVSYHPSTQPEIIIEPEDDDGPYDSSGDQFSSGSNLHQSVVPPPAAEEMPTTGGGIRRPFSSEEEMEFGESDPKPSFVNKTRSTTTQAPELPISSPENNDKISNEEEINQDADNISVNENYSGPGRQTDLKFGKQVDEEEEIEEEPNTQNDQTNSNQFEEEPLETEELKGTEKGILKVPKITNSSREENSPEESKVSEELKPSPTRYDPRVNILKNQKRPMPKLEEKIRHPSIESFEDFKGSPVDNYGSQADNSPVTTGSREQQIPAAGGSSYEEYESEETLPQETRVSDEIKEQTLSNEVAATNNDELNKNPDKIVSSTQDIGKQPSYEELEEDDKYSQSTEDTVTPAPAEDTNRVHRVYSVSYEQSTTESPSEENKQSTTPNPTSSNADDKSKGFNPPRPENFHENKYTFSPQIPDSGVFQSKDGWRPVVYDRNANAQSASPSTFRNALTRNPNSNSNRFTTAPTPQSSAAYFSTAPLYSTLTGVPSPPPLITPTPPLSANEDYEEEEEASYEDHNQPENGAQSQWPGNNNNQPLKIKPSQPIPSPPTPSQVKGQEEEGASQSHKTTQPQSTLQNQIIDRSKYMVRPAPPPIVMRRTPHANMPFLPPRPNRPHQATIPNKPQQFLHAPLPTHKLEYPHPPHPINTNVPGRPSPGRFKQMSAGRPRSNIQWPTDEDRRTVFPANRRNG